VERWVGGLLGVSGLIYAIPAFLLLPVFFPGFIFWFGRVVIAFGDQYFNRPSFWFAGIVWELFAYLVILPGSYSIAYINPIGLHSMFSVSLSLGVIAVLLSRGCRDSRKAATSSVG
jgi:hypothetical protein